MSRQLFFLTILFVSLAAFNCRHKPDGNVILDGTDLGDPIEPQQHDIVTTVPTSLWSPAQRRATAGYHYFVAEMIALQERQPTKSLPFYESAYGLDPNPFLGAKLISAKAQAGERNKATIEAKRMVLLYPKSAHLHLIYGELLLRSGQYEVAEKEFERSIDLDPHQEEAYSKLIELHQRSGEPNKAIVVTKELVENIPNSLYGWTQLSRLYISTNQYKKALMPARRAYEQQSNNPHLIQVYAVVLQLNGKTKLAIQMYEKLYRLNPTDSDLTNRMVELYRELGNLKDALSLLDEMIKESGSSNGGVNNKTGLLMQKAIVLWELDRFQDAAVLLDDLTVQNPESDRLKYMAGLGNERLEKLDKALSYYNQIPASSSFSYHAKFRVIVILRHQKKFDEALAKAEELNSHEQLQWEFYGVYAGVFVDKKDFDRAIEALDGGIKKFPDRPRLLFLKGVYQEKAGDVEKCIATMREVIKKDPANSSAYNYLGYLYAERGENLEEAEQLIKKALELKPNDGFYLDSLGWVYFQKGDYKNASEKLEEAARIEPKEGVILEHLGDLHGAQGDESKAKSFYNKALKVNLEDRDRERVKKKLEELD